MPRFSRSAMRPMRTRQPLTRQPLTRQPLTRQPLTLSLAALGLTALATVALVLAPSSAQACGGCFSPVVPTTPGGQYVVQDAERVVFTHNPKTSMTRVWVEVRYTGAAKDFGWVLPMPKAPTITVGTTIALNLIDGTTAPRFILKSRANENCRNPRLGCVNLTPPQPDSSVADASSGSWADSGSTSGGGGAPNVTVISAGQTGPYDYVVLASKSATSLQSWLTTRGYKTPAKATSIIQSHLDKGDVFVAIKLSNGQGVNQIRPIVLTMKDADACVPLRLTSIAAADDMSVIVTLGGPGRAVPKNMLHVQLNEALINWGKGGSNYEQLLAAAIDEAGGRAFATQSAMPGTSARVGLWTKGTLSVEGAKNVTNLFELAQWLQARGKTWLHGDAANVFVEKAGIIEPIYKPFSIKDPLAALQQLWVCGAIWNGASSTPNTPAETPCIKGGTSFFDNGPKLTPAEAKAIPVNGVALAKALDAEIAQPMLTLFDELGASKTVTRLGMRISADEMDRDPIFGFHPGLPDVLRTKTAESNGVCSTGWPPVDRMRLNIASVGSYVITNTGELGSLALDPRFAKAPVARVIEVLDESGAPLPVATPQIDLVDTALAGAVLGEVSPAKKLSLSKPNLWQPPTTDSIVTTVGAWPKPWNCIPKEGWADGKLPPTSASIDAGSTADVDEDGQATGSDAGGGGVQDGGVTDSSSGGATDVGGKDGGSKDSGADDGCSARPSNSGTPLQGGVWFVLLAGACGLIWRRRQRLI